MKALRLFSKLMAYAVLCFVSGLVPAKAADDFLDPEVAFKAALTMRADSVVEIKFKIAEGYYLYREKFKFKLKAGDVTLSEAQLPKAKIKFDETFQKDVEYYRHEVNIALPVNTRNAQKNNFVLEVTSQGCADKGLCYAPMQTVAELNWQNGKVTMLTDAAQAAPKKMEGNNATSIVSSHADSSASQIDSSTNNALKTTRVASSGDDASRIEAVLQAKNWWAGIAIFLGIGLLLTFTPCVLPMVPILSSIIVGEGNLSKQEGDAKKARARAFWLSLAYTLGMALVYTSVGVVAGLIGEGLTAALQNPWVLSVFALLLIALALSMFGYYELQLPAALRDKLSRAQNQQQGGKLLGVFIMGALSAIVVGPCVSAPLAGILTFIAQTKDAWFGGTMLFAMALGMGVPLLLIGIGAGSVLPRAGMWMEAVKRFFGVLLIAVAIWMVSPVLPAWLQMVTWGVLFAGCAAYLFTHLPQKFHWMAQALAALLALLAALQIVGVATGGRDVLQPLAQFNQTSLASGNAKNTHPQFVRIQTEAQLQTQLGQLNGKPALLDFYADWCVSCKEMERFTFNDARVNAAMQKFVLLQADVTGNNAEDKALLKRFKLFGPPGIIFFNQAGQEQGKRVIGYQAADLFLQNLNQASAR